MMLPDEMHAEGEMEPQVRQEDELPQSAEDVVERLEKLDKMSIGWGSSTARMASALIQSQREEIAELKGDPIPDASRFSHLPDHLREVCEGLDGLMVNASGAKIRGWGHAQTASKRIRGLWGEGQNLLHRLKEATKERDSLREGMREIRDFKAGGDEDRWDVIEQLTAIATRLLEKGK